ncbi:hypothetical protein FUAX_50030 (plasmid) [Fulvitalea axinellae]|uniref:Initiator Rep protein WH1 domain-containing protein n=1 Tax=Fulvitalea axinellae TaxID=1182444 RepID=A0AAU9CU57_9BACT|nr:hypothetical protein FUAX_50030 [Fulvitalea axinellae]
MDSNVFSLDYKLVKKSNHIINARQNFSLMQQRIILLMCSRIGENDQEFKWTRIPIQEIAGKTRLNGSDYEKVKRAAMELVECNIELRTGDGGWQKLPFLTTRGHDRKGIVEAKFVEDAKPFLLGLKERYTAYFLKNVYQLKNVHSLRLYELMAQYFPKIKERRFSLEDFKDLLYIRNCYPKYSAFKKHVLEKAVSEINATSDLFVTYEERREKRQVLEIIFSIRANGDRALTSATASATVSATPTAPKTEPVTEDVPHEVVDSVPVAPTLFDSVEEKIPEPEETKEPIRQEAQPPYEDINFCSEATFKKLTSRYDEDLVRLAIRAIAERPDIVNPTGYLIKSLSEGYFNDRMEQEKKVAREKIKRLEETRRIEELKRIKDRIPEEYDLFRKTMLAKYREKATDDDLAEYLFEIEDHDDMVVRRIHDDFLSGNEPSSLSKSHFGVWLVKRYGTQKDMEMLDVKNYAMHRYGIDY